MILDVVLVSDSFCYIILLYFWRVYNITCLFRLGIYRIPDHEAIATLTTVGIKVVLIVMLDEVELPLSAPVVHTWHFYFRILD